MDQFLFYEINNLATHSVSADGFFKYISSNDEFVILYGGIVAALLTFKSFVKRIQMTLTGLSAGALTWYLATKSQFFLWFHHARPYVVLSNIHLLAKRDPKQFYASFPSGHAIFFFSVATAVYLVDKRLGIAFYVLALVLSFAKIYTGVHWPSDILAGGILGIIIGYILNWVFEKLIAFASKNSSAKQEALS